MDEERDYKVGDYRLIPKGIEIWSIKNQESFVLCGDVIVKVNNICRDNHYVFCSKMITIFGHVTSFGGDDEWSVDCKKTLPYKETITSII